MKRSSTGLRLSHKQIAQASDRRPRTDPRATAQLGVAGRNHRRVPRGKRVVGRGSGCGSCWRFSARFNGGEHTVSGGHDQGSGGAVE